MTIYILWKLTLSLSVRNIHIRLGIGTGQKVLMASRSSSCAALVG
jgi:hypothetical protein